MRKVLRVLAPAMLGVLLFPSMAHADGRKSGFYIAGSEVAASTSSHTVAGVTIGVGGFSFTTSTGSATIDITDVSGPGTLYEICQHNSTKARFCGTGAGDIDIHFCTTESPRAFSGFNTQNPVVVFVFQADILGHGCTGTGTVGSFSVSW